jgi:hypothetical protein
LSRADFGEGIGELLTLKEDEPATQVIWALRKKQLQQVYGGEKADALPARGALGSRIRAMVEANKLEVVSPFFISELSQVDDTFAVQGTLHSNEAVISGVHEIISNTGSRPDTSFLREVRAAFDPVLESVPDLAPLIDPNVHSCGSVRPHGEQELRQPEKDFYVVGLKSYGRAPTFLMATGYEQVRSVVAALVGDWDAAAKVELNLPQTGVCSSNRSSPDQVPTVACCGPEDSLADALSCCGPAEPVEVAVPTKASTSCCGPAKQTDQARKGCC